MLAAGKIKLSSVDSVAGQALLAGKTATEIARVQARLRRLVYHELVPAIRRDCRSTRSRSLVTGPSIGAFHALSMICRHPDAFSKAICMSGTYDVTKWMNHQVPQDHYFASPLHFLPVLGEGEQLARLRRRFVLLAHGTGRFEEPQQSWRAAEVLGKKGVPNRVDAWDEPRPRLAAVARDAAEVPGRAGVRREARTMPLAASTRLEQPPARVGSSARRYLPRCAGSSWARTVACSRRCRRLIRAPVLHRSALQHRPGAGAQADARHGDEAGAASAVGSGANATSSSAVRARPSTTASTTTARS